MRRKESSVTGLVLAALFYLVIALAFLYGATDGRGTITEAIHNAMIQD